MTRETIRRRDLLQWGCAAGIAGLAGCGGQVTDETPQASTPCGVTSPVAATNAFAMDLAFPQNASVLGTRSVEGIPIEEIPIELHRRAAGLIETVGGTDIAPEWEVARLTDAVYPFHRPDLEEVAYYEFGVEPSGFVVLSTGEHDFPVAHWNSVGPPVSRALERRAEEASAEAARFYKLDTLTYAVEDREGERVATLGPRLPRVVGLNEEWFAAEPGIRRTLAVPSGEAPTDDEITEDTEYTVKQGGPEPLPVELEPWDSWQELKAGYEATYDVLLELLRQQAEEDWAVYRSIREFGRGITSPYTVRFLYSDARYEVVGQGEDLVGVELVTPGEGPSVLEITPEETVEVPVRFGIVISYPNGQREELRFFLQPTDTQRGRLKGAIGVFSLAGQSSGTSTIQIEFHRAGSEPEQRRYQEFVDDDGCAIGPGAAGWAMLFGWADHQACIGTPYWYPRWGLFRRNAGKDPQPDIDAPRGQTGVVETASREIHDYTGTCDGLSSHLIMNDARKYFRGRTGTTLDTQLSRVTFRSESRLRNLARETIANQDTPVVIGKGHGGQYPLAWKYKELKTTTESGGVTYEKKFYVNHTDQYGDGWIPSPTWFCGRICPQEVDCR